MNKEKFYITTSIAYVNAAPHIGFAMECLQADALARYAKSEGRDVFSLTGTDEHGVKLFHTAREMGLKSQKLADENAEKFKRLKSTLNLDYDYFVRTTDSSHKNGAQVLWKKIEQAGDLYKDKYSGYYCVGCEAYVTEKDLADGKCPIHKTEPDWLEEENYYFRLSKYETKLRDLIEKDVLKILPVERKNEILSLINGGLKDVSFSRPKKILPWGIEVPNDDSQVMYVWCDALSNYITALNFVDDGDLYKKFWPADVHLIGKDILRFHAALWPAMLMSAQIALPKAVYVHGFITSEGHKMSKSLGNVVDPFAYVEEFGTDALRYYLLREIPTTGDGDFSRQRFISLYNDELANNFGNLVNRVLTMIHKYSEGKVQGQAVHEEVIDEIDRVINDYRANFELFDLREAMGRVLGLVDFANKYIDEEKPWILAKESPEQLAVVMKGLLEIVYRVGRLFLPFIPGKMEMLLAIFPKKLRGECLIAEEMLVIGDEIGKLAPLFPRIENLEEDAG